MKKYFAIPLFASLLIGCKKDDVPALSNTPYIEIKAVAPTTVQAFTDTLSFTVFYRDGDGDLGENNANVYNLFLTDNRNNVTYKYRIQQLGPDNSTVAIQGNLNVKLPGAPILGSGTTETVTYSVYVVDRAGNLSNTATSPTITLNQ